MFKRARWMTMGYAAGIGSSFYVARRVRQAAHRYAPPELRERASEAARDAGARVSDALADGRTAMREREQELRHSLGLEGRNADSKAVGPPRRAR